MTPMPSPNQPPSKATRAALLAMLAPLLLVAGCAITPGGPRDTLPPDEARALVGRLLPAATADRAGWAADVVTCPRPRWQSLCLLDYTP